MDTYEQVFIMVEVVLSIGTLQKSNVAKYRRSGRHFRKCYEWKTNLKFPRPRSRGYILAYFQLRF